MNLHVYSNNVTGTEGLKCCTFWGVPFCHGIWCWNLHIQLFNITLRQNILIKKGFSGPGDKLSFLFLGGMFGWKFDVCELPINAINTSLFHKIYTRIFLCGLSHEFCNSFVVFLHRVIELLLDADDQKCNSRRALHWWTTEGIWSEDVPMQLWNSSIKNWALQHVGDMFSINLIA